MRRILALAAFASLMPFAAVADDLGAADDIVVEQARPPAPTVVKETVVREEKAVSLPPPGWHPKPSAEKTER